MGFRLNVNHLSNFITILHRNRKKRSLEGSENADTALENQAEPANKLIAPAVIVSII